MAEEAENSSRKDRYDGEDRQMEQWYRLTGLGIEFIVAVLLLGGAGWWLDSYLGTTPWLMLVGGALGFAIGLWLLLRAAFRSFRNM